MRIAAFAVAALVAATDPVFADEPDATIAEGEALAKRGDFAGAIERFKVADRTTPRARHSCMIGLTYLRMQNVSRAELFLRRCRVRATASDPLPDWIADAERQLAEQLAAGTFMPLEIIVRPAGVKATVTVSSFGADEMFEPQAIHLPYGPHQIAVSAPGYVTAEQQIVASATGAPTLEIVLVPVVAPPEPPPPVATPIVPPVEPPVEPSPARRSHGVSNVVLATSGILAAGGIVFHVLAFQTRGKLEDAADGDAYHDNEKAFDIQRGTTFALYGLAAIGAGVGIYLRTRETAAVQVGATVRPDGALVTIGWRR